jgi:predicted transcriptional regulator
MKIIISLAFALICSNLMAMPQVGKPLPTATLSGDLGGKVDGSGWNTKELAGKVQVIFYVDPDEKNTNNHVSEAIAAEKFDRTYYGSMGIINMDATWLPNGIIASSLKKKQEKYPNTVYVKDMEKTLVKVWKVADDASNILVLSPDSTVLFAGSGKIADDKVKMIVKTIREEIEKLKASK